tara:strand:+ start:149 stop:652 length:504 start_codon:yes stop_codon:yes gene_type:complete
MLERINQKMGSLLHFFGLIAGYLTFGITLLVVVNIISRFFFNAPMGGTLEVTEAALPIIIFLSLALTQHKGEHIKVTLVMRRFSPKYICWGNVVTSLLGCLFFAWATYAAWDLFIKSFMMNEKAWGSIILPLYPVKFIIFIGLLMLSIQFFIDALLFIQKSNQRALS